MLFLKDCLLHSERHHYTSATRLHADELTAILLVEITEWNGELWGLEHDVPGQPLSCLGCRGSYSGRSAVVFTSIWAPFKATTTLPRLAAVAIACIGEGGAGNTPCKAHDVSVLPFTSSVHLHSFRIAEDREYFQETLNKAQGVAVPQCSI